MSLEVNALSGGYGQVPVLKDVTFTVPDGQVVGSSVERGRQVHHD